ncbi:MAG: hypothetical protein LC775_02790, partial [Acidobacteria bacterium]|nr:hypothetical protein [Acidobacteriota bacterium]
LGINQNARAGQSPIKRAQVKPTVAEVRLLEVLLTDEKLRCIVLPKLEPGDYDHLPTGPIFRALLEGEREGTIIDFDFLSRKTESDPISELLPSLLIGDLEGEKGDQSEVRALAAERCLNALRLMKVDRRISDLRSEIAAAERNGEAERCDRLVTEQIELTRHREGLLPKADAMQHSN